jgi:hypothetical protein
MGHPAKHRRTLWLTFAIGFALSLIGAAILFIPTLEFTAVDVIEKLGLPTGLLANIAMISDYSLFIICGVGLIILSIRWLIIRTGAD